MIERALLATVALVIAVLAGLWIHSVRLEKSGNSIAERPPARLSARDVARAARLFERSRAHNPDGRPIEREAGLLIRTGHDRRGVALLRPLVNREPDDVTAWVLIAVGARTGDRALAAQAVTRARALNPLDARAR